MVDTVQNRTATLLAEHSRTSGMAVSMGWTCRCGHWCENVNDATGHQAAMLNAAGLLAAHSPRARTRRSGTRACRAVEQALYAGGYDPAWIGSVGPESVWSDGPCPPVGTTWCGRFSEMLSIISPGTYGWCSAPRGEVSGGSFNVWEWDALTVRKLCQVHPTD